MPEGTNTVNLKAIIEFVAKLDKNSVKTAQAEMQKGMSGIPLTGSVSSAQSKEDKQQADNSNKMVEKVGNGIDLIWKIFDVLTKISKIAMDASPLFQAVTKLYQTTMKLIFMPLGNMIAKILMPIMIKYVQKSAERAQKYANSPPSSYEEIASDTTTDMLEVLTDVVGTIFTKVFPPLLKGMLAGIVTAISNFFGGSGDVLKSFDNTVAKEAEEFTNAFSESGLKLVTGVTGYISALDQFGLSIQTSNNRIGKTVSDSATVFYTGVSDISQGFTNSAEVVVYGTSSMIENLNEKFNLMAAGVTTVFDTVTGNVNTYGQIVELSFNGLGKSINQHLNTDDPSTIMGSLSSLGTNINSLATTIGLVIESIKGMLSQGTSETTTNPETVGAKYSTMSKVSTQKAWKWSKSSEREEKTLTPEQAKDLGYEGKSIKLTKFNGAYVISDAYTGKVLEEGMYDTALYRATMNKRGASGGWGQLSMYKAKAAYALDVNDTSDSRRKLINTMAYGGVATSPTRRIVGEAGPEAVIPLSNDVLNGSTSNLMNTLKNYTSLLGAGGLNYTATTNSNKLGKQKAEINISIGGNVYGVDDLKQTFREAMDEYTSSYKGAF